MSHGTQATNEVEPWLRVLTVVDLCRRMLPLDEALLQKAMREYAESLSQEHRLAA